MTKLAAAHFVHVFNPGFCTCIEQHGKITHSTVSTSLKQITVWCAPLHCGKLLEVNCGLENAWQFSTYSLTREGVPRIALK